MAALNGEWGDWGSQPQKQKLDGDPDLLLALPFYPIISDTPLPQTLPKADLEYYQRRADRDFPDIDESDIALEMVARSNNVEGLFFSNEDGERQTWGPDLNYFSAKHYRGKHFNMYETPNSGRRFLVKSYKENTLAKIDRPKPAEMTGIIAHRIEGEWNQPTDHPRHLLHFPPGTFKAITPTNYSTWKSYLVNDATAAIEILELILEFSVTIEKPASLQPSVVACNWKTKWSQPMYTVKRTRNPIYHENKIIESKCESVAMVPRYDVHGQYIELRKVLRTAIDASCLRTNKAIHKAGKKLLYGRNNFVFPMVNIHYECTPPSLLHPKDKKQWRPNPRKPDFNVKWSNKIERAKLRIESKVNLKKLPGWVYYDPFLRFLWTIGPSNAALLRSLQFEGIVKLHQCDEGIICDGGCNDGLADSLRHYTPFIARFCPNLEKLTLCAAKDHAAQKHPLSIPEGGPRTHDEALLPLLELHIRNFPVLKELEVYDSMYKDGSLLECAEPTRAWLKKRAAHQARKELEEEFEKRKADMTARMEAAKITANQNVRDLAGSRDEEFNE